MRRTAAILLATTALLALGACGDDDSTGGTGASSGGDSQTAEGQQYVDAMMSTFDAQDAGFPEEDARCVAESTVDVVGVKALQDAGVTPEDIAASDGSDIVGDYQPSEQQADELVDRYFGCVDFGELFVSQMTQSTDVQLPEDKLRCIGEQMQSSDAIRASLKASILGDDSAASDPFNETEITKMFDACNVDFADLMGS